MGRAPCCDKANVKRGPWSPDEDEALKNYIAKHGTGGNWISLPNRAGLNRCGKSCRLRWLNYLRPDIKHGGFTEEEDHIICSLYLSLGSRWSFIASKLPGRTDNDVKNYWNTKLKKKLMAKKDCLRTSNKIPELEGYESYYTGKDSGHFLNCHRPETLDPNPVSLPDDLIKFSECSGFATPSALPFDELTTFAPPSWQTFQNIELDSAHDSVSRFGFPDKHEVYDPYLANISLFS